MTIALVGCFAMGIALTYNYMKIKQLETAVEQIYLEIPTPEEMAKEVIKVKVPLTDLPPEMASKMKNMFDNSTPKPIPVPSSSLTNSDRKWEEVHHYTG